MDAELVVKLNDVFCFIWQARKRLSHNVWRRNFELLQTNKQSELLIFDGYGYITSQPVTDSAFSRRFSKRKFNDRVRIGNEKMEVMIIFSHLPDPGDIDNRKFFWALKDRADETPRLTIFHERLES